MEISNFIGGFVVLFFGLITRIFKASGLIAGYNTASKEEKAKYDEEKLTRYVGNMLIVSSIILLFGGLLTKITSIKPLYMISISWVLFTFIIIGGVIYMNIGNHLKK